MKRSLTGESENNCIINKDSTGVERYDDHGRPSPKRAMPLQHQGWLLVTSWGIHPGTWGIHPGTLRSFLPGCSHSYFPF